MPEIRLELSTEDVRKLDTEVDLLGFEGRAAYLRWIIGNRAAIEQGTERDQLLTEYQSRVDELEAELSARDADAEGAASVSTDAADGDTRTTEAGSERSERSAAESDRARATDGSGTTTQGPDETTGAGAAAETTQSTLDADNPSDESTTDGSRSGREPKSVEAEAAHGNSHAENAPLGGNFTPERVERFEDESLGSHANQLKGVEGERLDEFARRAVAKTRQQLGREPATGLDYQSGTRIARSSPDVRPGEDLVDLDALDVPGRSESACAPRREAVGAALAYLRDVDRAKRGDFVEELYDEYPAGYDTKSGWWRCVKRGLTDAPVVEGGGNGSRVYRYVAPGSREGELVGSGPKRVVDPE
jgi:hypothetical protein